jgi:hypothetical protein
MRLGQMGVVRRAFLPVAAFLSSGRGTDTDAVERAGCVCGAAGCGPEQRVPAFFAVDGHGDQADDSADDAADEDGGNRDCHECDGHCGSC